MDQTTDTADLSLSELLDCVHDGPQEGRFEVARRIFADPAIFMSSRNVDAEPRGGYPDHFETLSHDLAGVKVGVYRGFTFGSPNDVVDPIEQHLCGSAAVIDAMAATSPRMASNCCAPPLRGSRP